MKHYAGRLATSFLTLSAILSHETQAGTLSLTCNDMSTNPFISADLGCSADFAADNGFVAELDAAWTLHFGDGISNTISYHFPAQAGSQALTQFVHHTWLGPSHTISYTLYLGEGYEIDNLGNIIPLDFGTPSSFAAPLGPLFNFGNGLLYQFEILSDGTSAYVFDPPVTTGYSYDLTSGSNFRSIELPPSSVISNSGPYKVTYDSGTSLVSGGSTFDFPAGGVSSFTISGIDPSLGLDPGNALAFPVGIRFESLGQEIFTMSALAGDGSSSVPEPNLLGVFGMAAIGLAFGRAKREQTGR
jgi:hypothetical protein